MSLGMSIAFGCYAFVAVASLAQGILYLTRSSIMPWHEVAVGTPWQGIPPPMQSLLLAQLRVAGAGMFTAGLSVGLLLVIPFRAGEPWARYAVPAIALCLTLPLLAALWRVRQRTPGRPPLALLAFIVALVLVGFVASHT